MTDVELTTETFSVRPIGVVRSPLRDLDEAPRQPDEDAPAAELVFREQVAAALEGIAAGSVIELLTWLHLAGRDTLQTRPRGAATRALPASSPLAHPTDPTRSDCTLSRSSRQARGPCESPGSRRSTERRSSTSRSRSARRTNADARVDLAMTPGWQWHRWIRRLSRCESRPLRASKGSRRVIVPPKGVEPAQDGVRGRSMPPH
jgi:hypothetical protein